MALAVETIATSMSQLSVSGLTIRDIDELQGEFFPRDCPVLIPEPAGFMTDLTVERQSVGVGTAADKDVTYALHYTLLYAQIGEGRLGLELYDEMVDMAAALIDAIMAADDLTGAIDVTPSAYGFGPVTDPAGKMFVGCRVDLHVLEYQ
jgi:hypothetical protein